MIAIVLTVDSGDEITLDFPLNEAQRSFLAFHLLHGGKIVRFEENWGLDWNPDREDIKLDLHLEEESITLYDKFSRLDDGDQLLAWMLCKYSTYFPEEVVEDPCIHGEFFLGDPEVYFLLELREVYDQKTVDHMIAYFGLTRYTQMRLISWRYVAEVDGYLRVH